ncbi:cadherin domain-containing protein, partial [Sulfuricurvum sp.]|uniref:cadherin domain-containing protein n=1 Tax=Sulfuricurvum sp. TaxID=2025608 RepID=UPI002618D187
SINTATGEVRLNTSADYETKSSYSFNVVADDGVNTPTTQAVVLSINDLDEIPPAIIDPVDFVIVDTGVSSSDGITSDTTIDLTLATDAVRWEYSTDGGTTWSDGSGNTIPLSDDTYDKKQILVKQYDLAGNNSISVMSTTNETPVLSKLDPINSASMNAQNPQIASVGNNGEFVVTFEASDSNGDSSVFVQKFNADGTVSGSMVQLEAISNTNGGDYAPQVSAVGNSGAYAVTFYGIDSNGGYSVFVQQFNADGTILGSMVGLESFSYGNSRFSQIASVGNNGEYVVVFEGDVSFYDYSIVVQKFNADGTVSEPWVSLEAIGNTTGIDSTPTISSIGTTGEFVVTFYGTDSNGDNSAFVQKFNADGTASGSMIQLEGINVTNGNDLNPKVSALGDSGKYVVTFYGTDNAGDNSIFIQQFNSDGSVFGSMIQLEPSTISDGNDYDPDIVGLGNTGEFVVVFSGTPGNSGMGNIYVQKYDGNGTQVGSMVSLTGYMEGSSNSQSPEVCAIGNTGEYVVVYMSHDENGDESIYVQQFNADGTLGAAKVKVEAQGITTGYDMYPHVTMVGNSGEYAVTFSGNNINGTYPGSNQSIYVQLFNADGTAKTDNINRLIIDTTAPTITSLTTATTIDENSGAGQIIYTVTATDTNSVTYSLKNTGDYSLISIDGTTGGVTLTENPNYESKSVYSFTVIATDTAGNASEKTVTLSINNMLEMVQLEALNNNNANDINPQITSIKNDESYVVTWQGVDSEGDESIFVQKFDAFGNTSGNTIQLEATTSGADTIPQITSVGTDGSFVVTWKGIDSNGYFGVFVQKFDATGSLSGSTVQLNALNIALGSEYDPRITSVGTDGSFVVTFFGYENTGDDSVFVQKFDASATPTGNMVKLEAIGNNIGFDYSPQITTVGTDGSFVVTWFGIDNDGGDWSVYVQKFDASGAINGVPVMLEAVAHSSLADVYPQIASIGNSGAYVVAFVGNEGSDNSIFVQRFNANGTVNGTMTILEAIDNTAGVDDHPHIASVGEDGSFVVVWQGVESEGDDSIFVQKFDASGSLSGSTVKLEVSGNTTGMDQNPQITSVGTQGDFVVTWQGVDSVGGDTSIYLQKFNADGSLNGTEIKLEALNRTDANDYNPQITSVGEDGSFVVTWYGSDATEGDYSVFTYKFVGSNVSTPTFTTSSANVSVAENTSTSIYQAHVNDSDWGATINYTLSGIDASYFNIDSTSGEITFKTSPDYEIPIDNGLDNVYDFTIHATDTTGNSTDQSVALSVTNVAEKGDSLIDLGSYGNLIAPVQVNGNWYYYWDRSGNGTSADTGALNGGVDYITHDVLDAIFTYASDFTTTGGGGNTDNTYRYATINGVQVALPTTGTGISNEGASNYYLGNDQFYTDLAAIWDTYNSGNQTQGIPTGWQSNYYWSSTPSDSGHALVYTGDGFVVNYFDGDTGNGYVALQVL